MPANPAARAGALTRTLGKVQSVVFKPADRPCAEVLVDGTWRYSEVRMWSRREDGWWASVQWQPARGESYRLDAFPAADVRELGDIGRYLA